jgi:hypothetical protein
MMKLSKLGMRDIILISAVLISGCIMIQGCYRNTAAVPYIQSNLYEGREFSSLSVHPNGEELFFVEIDRKQGLHTRMFHYNLKNGSLQYYNLPDADYIYWDVKISPSGKYIIMTRTPRLGTVEDAEIAIMKSDGTDFKVLKLSHGLKHDPIMSNDDNKVAYWRGYLRPSHSKTLANEFDIWEVDLKTGTDRLFSAPFKFFESGQMQYLHGDGEILAQAYGPEKEAQNMNHYGKLYNKSNVYKFSRREINVPAPILTEVSYASHPVADRAGNIYFKGYNPSAFLFKKTSQGKIRQWEMTYPFANITSSTVTLDGGHTWRLSIRSNRLCHNMEA